MLVVIGLMMTPWSIFSPRGLLKFGVVDALYLDFARPEIDHSVIGSHKVFSFALSSQRWSLPMKSRARSTHRRRPSNAKGVKSDGTTGVGVVKNWRNGLEK